MKIIFILNSDFGIRGTIGSRVLPVARRINKSDDIKIYCRDYYSGADEEFDIKKIVPLGKYIMKFFTAIPIYIYKKFPSNKIKNYISEYFIIKKLKKEKLDNINIIQCWDYMPKVFKFIKENNPKIIIIKDTVMAFPNILNEINFSKTKFKPETLNIEKEEKDSMQYIDFFISPSENTTKSIINEDISLNKILEMPYGFDTNTFNPYEDKDFNSKFKVAFVGNVNLRKGIDILIPIWKELNLKNAELNIYGRVYDEIKYLLKDSLKHNIKIHGFCDISKELPKNHILIHLSFLETTPKCINESLASGLPVITTWYSGPNFEDSKEGFILKNHDKDKIKDKIKELYNNRDKLKEMSYNARKLAEKYSWKDYSEKLYNKYKEIIK